MLTSNLKAVLTIGLCVATVALGVQPDTRVIYELSPAFKAVITGDTAQLKYLLRHGANPNERSPTDWTLLHYAMFARKEVSDVLLAAGADVNATANMPAGSVSK
jgi:ankyrin repeat protein